MTVFPSLLPFSHYMKPRGRLEPVTRHNLSFTRYMIRFSHDYYAHRCFL